MCLTLSAVSWPPAGAFSRASALDSLCEEGAVPLGPATSLSLASAFDLLPSTLESPSTAVSFGRLGDALQRVDKCEDEQLQTDSEAIYFFLIDSTSKSHLCGLLCFTFSSSPFVLLVNDQGPFILITAPLRISFLRAACIPCSFRCIFLLR